MPLLRHQALLLDHAEPTDLPIDGPAFQVRPNDADSTLDNQQHFGLFVALTRDGDGVTGAQLFTSVDKVSWHPVATVVTPQDDRTVVQFVEIPAFFPYVKVRTTTRDASSAARAPGPSTAAPAPTPPAPSVGTPAPTASPPSGTASPPPATTPTTAPPVAGPAPKHTVLARLFSDAPFTLSPA